VWEKWICVPFDESLLIQLRFNCFDKVICPCRYDVSNTAAGI